MKIPWLHIVIFALLLVGTDRIAGYGISKGARAYEYDKRLADVLEGNCNHRGIIIGSSRALIDVDAVLLSEDLNRDFFNLGFSGANTEFHVFGLNLLLERNQKPDTVLLFIDEFRTFTGTANAKFREDFLRPYVFDDVVYGEYCQRVDKNYPAGVLSSVYRQNENTISAISYLLDGTKPPDNTTDVNERGSILLNDVSPGFTGEYPKEKKDYPVDDEKPELIAAFKEVFTLCKTHAIDLILVYPPNYRKPSKAFKERIHTHMPYPVPEIVLDTMLQSPEFYYDRGHLNKDGNIKFTRALAGELKKLN